jgi:hypothetical protein
MNFITGKMSIPSWLILVITLSAILILLLGWYYFISDNNVKLLSLIGGIVAGLVVAILTFVIQVSPLQELDRFKRMGIKEVLANRHDKIYYGRIVADAENTVCVMGASCTRFVEDFLDMESDDKVLVDALRKHRQLRVQLLVPDETHMAPEARARTGAVDRKMSALKPEFGHRVELRRFPAAAQHSCVISDNDLIAGPIFESDKGKYAPAVHVAMSTVFAQKYKEHFDDVWENSSPKLQCQRRGTS